MHKYSKYDTIDTAGYITLLSVLIIGAMGVAITVTLLLLGMSAERSSFAFEQSSHARVFAD